MGIIFVIIVALVTAYLHAEDELWRAQRERDEWKSRYQEILYYYPKEGEKHE